MLKIQKPISDILSHIKPQKIFSSRVRIESDVLKTPKNTLDLKKYHKVHVLCLGKAAMDFAKEWTRALPTSRLGSVFVITKQGHSSSLAGAHIWEGTHPLVSQKNIEITQELIEKLSGLEEKDILLVTITGGTSALLELPASWISFPELVSVQQKLLHSSLGINEMNELRKLCSRVKNGGLLDSIPCPVANFYLSDIPCDDFHVIGSSPTAFQRLRPQIIEEVLGKVFEGKLKEKLSKATREVLAKERLGERVLVNETLADYHYLTHVAREALTQALPGFVINIEETPRDESIDVTVDALTELIGLARGEKQVFLSGGESTVHVRGEGLGGRNTHFVAMLGLSIFERNILNLSIEELNKVIIVSIGTDGTDGPTDAAGAWLDYAHYQKGVEQNFFLEDVSKSFDSYSYFARMKTLIKTGPTGSNLMDLRIVLVDG